MVSSVVAAVAEGTILMTRRSLGDLLRRRWLLDELELVEVELLDLDSAFR